jgi:hypothetical protein
MFRRRSGGGQEKVGRKMGQMSIHYRGKSDKLSGILYFGVASIKR